tara:strand:- start:86 stop:268 length:183 start_codon:yes stop_codon:yes gene_type:complete
MNNGMVLFLCFLPLGIIYIVMKLSLLLSSTSQEISYIKKESKKPHGPYISYEEEENEDDW